MADIGLLNASTAWLTQGAVCHHDRRNQPINCTAVGVAFGNDFPPDNEKLSLQLTLGCTATVTVNMFVGIVEKRRMSFETSREHARVDGAAVTVNSCHSMREKIVPEPPQTSSLEQLGFIA